MIGHTEVYDMLKALNIKFDYIEHPEAPTIEIAKQYWDNLDSTHCKNLFFRNHKGNRHYLVVFHCDQNLAIRDLEQRLKQGKLSFASPERMLKYLGLKPGSVSPFGLIHDAEHHVHLFLDQNLLDAERLSFHPNDNRASISLSLVDFKRYLEHLGCSYEWLELY